MTRLSCLRRVAPLALAASALLSCSTTPTEPPPPASEFTLEIIWLGTAPTGATLATFDAAVATVRATITGGLPSVAIPANFTNLSQCNLPGHPDIVRTNITGLRVYLLVEPIDGLSGTLGQAGPCLVRGSGIPALGYMRFDQADIANLQDAGRLDRVVLHEFMHVLGIGTVWYKPSGSLVDTLATPSDVRYEGALAREACVNTHDGAVPCATTVPVHSADGAGSRYSHWRESVFQSELMTPFLGAGAAPFSAMSIQALADIGYEVSLSRAQPYQVPAPAAAMLREGPPADAILLPEPVLPTWTLDGAGRLTPYRPRR